MLFLRFELDGMKNEKQENVSMAFNIGDSVVVKKGVKDPDLGNNIGAWHGRAGYQR
jgi:hypothetical protein